MAIEHLYAPRGACLELFNRREGEVVISGPAGTGKSRACLEKMHLMALATPRFRGLLVRQTAVSLAASAIATYETHVAFESLRYGHVTWFGGSQREAPGWRYSNGSSLSVGGLDKPSKIMSTEYDAIYVQEATELTVDGWEALTTRARNGAISFQQLMADCNPSYPTHWLYQRCTDGQAVILESRHEDNPRLFNPDGTLTEQGRAYIGRLDKLTGVRYKRLRKGLWVAAEGQVYDEYDSAVHLIERMPDDWEKWPRYWSIDWGFTNPLVVQFWAEDPDGRLYLYREIYHTERLVEDVARQVMDIVAPGKQWIEPQPQAIICDHDAEDRYTFERHTGLGTTPAKKDVSTGIQFVQARFRPAGDGKPRIYILRGALVQRDESLVGKRPVCTEQEILGYVWKKGLDGRPVPEEPVKENDHGCDAMRYLVVHRDSGSDSYFRWLD